MNEDSPVVEPEEVRVGRRTKTRITLMYLSDMAQSGLVREVRCRISKSFGLLR